MTGFDALIYTGPQLQAASAGVDPEVPELVRREVLHEPASGTDIEASVSFAHVGGEYLVTGAGTVLDPSAGPLTHAIATRESSAYGGLRPAQLYGAPFWATGPAASTTCDPVPAGPPVGRPDVKSVQAFVNRRVDGANLLACLLTALCGTTRVLFVAEQAEPVAMWIAAATLLMPMDDAVRIDFKIFTRTPTGQRHRILAMRPGAGKPPATVDQPGRYLVMDLRADRCSGLAVTAEARRWADLFTGYDPGVVVDAVDWTSKCGLSTAAAAALAEVLFTGRRPAPEFAATIVDWARDAPEELVAAYGPRLIDVLARDPAVHSKEVLARLDRVTSAGRYPAHTVPVRLAWLSAELDAAARGTAGSRDRPGRIAGDQWGASEDATAAALAIIALQAATGAGFAAMLQVAGRFGIPVALDAIGEPADAFVRFWAQHPELNIDPRTWPCGSEAKERLRKRLNERIDEGAVEPQSVGGRWASLLIPRFPLESIDGAIIGTQMAELDHPGRLKLVIRLVEKAAGAKDAPAQIGELARALWRWTSPTADELRAFAGRLPAGGEIDPGVVDQYLDDRIHGRHLDAADLDMVVDLERTGQLRPAAVAARRLESYAELRRIVERLPQLRREDRGLARHLAAMPDDVVSAYAAPLIKALLAGRVPGAVADLVTALSEDLRDQFAEVLSEALRGGAEPHVVAAAVVIADRSRNPSDRHTRMTEAVGDWLTRATPARVDRVEELLRPRTLKRAYAVWIGLRGGSRQRRSRG